MNYEIFSDGAYSSSRNQGGVAFVILKDGEKIAEYSRMYKNTTNIKMELLAVIHALKSFKKPVDSITLYTDSQYVIGCSTLGWQRKANTEYWALFDKVLKNLKTLCSDIKFVHVKGHSKNSDKNSKWNNYCDRLAVLASQEV